MPERLEPEKGRAEGPVFVSSGQQGDVTPAPAYVPPSQRHAPRSVTQVFPPLAPPGGAPAALSRNRPGGLRPGFREVQPYALPGGYGDDRVVIMPRDPQWLFAYWEISDGLRRAVARQYGPQVWESGRLVLRVYDVTDLRFDGTNAHRFWDVAVGEARNWYVQVGLPERDYCLDLGLALPDGRFILLARSNTVRTPADGFSALTDAEWLTLDEIYRQSLGLERSDSSEALVKAAARRLQELVSSPGVSSLMSPFGGAPGPRPFWLNVAAELVVYGSTEPGAALTVDGRTLALAPDGTFHLRLAYPDGEFTLPLAARSAHTGEERTITLRFRRETAAPQ